MQRDAMRSHRPYILTLSVDNFYISADLTFSVIILSSSAGGWEAALSLLTPLHARDPFK